VATENSYFYPKVPSQAHAQAHRQSSLFILHEQAT